MGARSSGIDENEMAGIFAKQGVSTPYMGPELTCCINRVAKSTINIFPREKQLYRWRKITGHELSKHLIKSPILALTKSLIRFGRRNLNRVVSTISIYGHFRNIS